MIAKFAVRFLSETEPRILFKFIYNFGIKGILSVNKFKKRIAKGVFSPAFVFVSVTNRCNLKCQGCWVHQGEPPTDISPEVLDRIIREFKAQGSYFFGILGGEPLLYPALFDVLSRHPDCYFQLFTNGTLITEALGSEMRRLGNITPLLSIEGLGKVSDERRSGAGVFSKTLRGLEICHRNKLVTGTATSVCKSNFDDLVSEKFVDEMISKGVHYLWYYIYRPSGANPGFENALDSDQIYRLRKFIVDQRVKKPIAIVDAYWDKDGNALCPAATGISHHINQFGDIEPCPVVQFSAENVSLSSIESTEMMAESFFLKNFRKVAAETSCGCIYLEHPGILKDFVRKENVRPSSGRENQICELDMPAFPGHDLGKNKIPEKSFFYRFAKKYWFFGFGAYG